MMMKFSYPVMAPNTQYSYVTGIYQLAEKACKVLWDEFVVSQHPFKHKDNLYQPFEVKTLALNSVPESIARQFVQSILISTQIKMSRGAFSDQLVTNGPPRQSQLQWIEQAKGLIVALQVSAMLNDSSLCLQAVVMVFGVLAPLIQHGIAVRPVVCMLLHCYSMIEEVPDALLVSKQFNNVSGLHHMIAGIAFFLGKVSPCNYKMAMSLLQFLSLFL